MVFRQRTLVGWGAAVLCCLPAIGQEKILYQKDSAYSTIVVSEDDQGLRTLRFGADGVRQSVVKLDDPDHLELGYARAMPAAMALVDQPRRVLIVGLGGGTIPRLLHAHFPQLEIDVVEIDPDVVAVATQYFGFQEDKRMRAYVDDGRRFIAQHRNRYDVIFLDAFSADSIPYHLATREFLLEVRRALTPTGLVAGNVWSRHSNRLYDSMVRTYLDVFESLYVIDVQGTGNKILLGLPRTTAVTQQDLQLRASRLARERGFRVDFAEAVKFGFRGPGDDGALGRVLTDAIPPAKAG